MAEGARIDHVEPAAKQTFHVQDVRETDVTVRLDDGRIFAVDKPESIALKRGQEVTLKHEGFDSHGVPKGATIASAKS